MKEEDLNSKILEKGSFNMSDAEILSVIIGGRDPLVKAKKLLNKADNSYAQVGRLIYFDMVNEGLSPSQAARVIASNAYSARKKVHEYPEMNQIKCSQDIYNIMSPIIQDIPHEEFWIIYMNRSNRVIKKEMLSKGGLSGTVTDVRIILKNAINLQASGMICCHNHPSGNFNPSEADSKITIKIKEAGKIMDIELLDHIIIANKDYYSFADNGLI